MMKKLSSAVIGLTVGCSLLGISPTFASDTKIVKYDMPIELLYNARQLPSDVQPEVVNSTTLIPLRVVSDKLGAKLTLTGKTINIVRGKSSLALTIGASTATINEKKTTLPVPVKVTKGRTLVPLRVVSEALGVAVEWDVVNQFVWIGSKDVPDLNNAVESVDFKPFKEYYMNAPDFLLNGGFGEYTNATVIGINDFPFKIGANTYYRFDLAYDQNKNAYLQVIEKTQATMNPAYYFLKKNVEPVISNQLFYLRQVPAKSIHVYINDISTLGGVRALRNVEYIDFRNVIQLEDGKSSAVLIKNPWR